MADVAAHLVDRVLPEVPIRQWVLTLPYPLRYFFPCPRRTPTRWREYWRARHAVSGGCSRNVPETMRMPLLATSPS